MVIGHQKGRDTREKIARNFGMPHPEGYRKALRLMHLAQKFGKPVVTFIDTPGAYPGLGAEERGQAEAIARNLREMAALRSPILAIVTGEGGSGGALAIGMGNRVLMLEYSIYSVISPEGCAAILWGDAAKAPEAAESMRITAPDLLQPRRDRRDRARAGRRRASRLGGRGGIPARRRFARTCATSPGNPAKIWSPGATRSSGGSARSRRARSRPGAARSGRQPDHRSSAAATSSSVTSTFMKRPRDGAAYRLELGPAAGDRHDVTIVAARQGLQPVAGHREYPPHQRPQLRPIHDASFLVERLVVDLADDAELAQSLDADPVRLGQRAEPRRAARR